MWGSVGTHVQACINLRVLACLRPTTLLALRHNREPFHNKYSVTRGELRAAGRHLLGYGVQMTSWLSPLLVTVYVCSQAYVQLACGNLEIQRNI